MAKGSQLGVSYRGGPLARDTNFMARLAGAFRSGPKPGDRAPDAPCYTHPAGEPTTLGRETCAGCAPKLAIHSVTTSPTRSASRTSG